MDGKSALDIELSEGLTLAVPANLESITTYVLLEQERWFEKEIDFLHRWLRPGMTVIDIGANLGVYSLPAARLVGPSGRVFAYEPGSETRALLERSRELNETVNLHISPCALSDGVREGRLVFGNSGELNALGQTGAGETVRIASLDSEDDALGWPAPDFIKIDAEGEEERIIAGGSKFFAEHSPLVMFEIKADKVNEPLRGLFRAIGYDVFRQLGGAPILVPDDSKQPVDRYELNLFAAKPDRIRALAQQGMLVERIASWTAGEAELNNADTFWRAQGFGRLVDGANDKAAFADQDYRESFAAYAVWRDAERPVALRCAALAFALQNLRTECERQPTAARLSTLARVAWEWGARAESVDVLGRLLQTMEAGVPRPSEPFLPASARFDAVALGEQPANWFLAAAFEQLVRASSFSSLISGATPIVEWLASQPFSLTEIERRRVLCEARAGRRPQVSPRLCQAAADHRNADIWRAGKVPGTQPPAQP
ncbi:MAG: FkbM family methyltransferase [Rhizobiales bacterium]|nr:FkbM family methyltransferase [Hyphomicrobiales bacterium]